MCEHDKRCCPRCGAGFECKMGSILICHCSDVQLSEQQTDFIAEHWADCLCHDCLLEISAMQLATTGGV
ncbi:MAG: cysteine-rich CWC family protein [Pseudomonadales bacterium]